MYIGRVLMISEIHSSSYTVENFTISYNHLMFIFYRFWLLLATNDTLMPLNSVKVFWNDKISDIFGHFGLAKKTINDFPTWWSNTWILILAWINLALLICLDFCACILHIPKHTKQRQSNFDRSLINRSHARTHFFRACVYSIYLINWSV